MNNNNILVIGIAGGTGSGKSTLTKQLVNHFGDQITVLKHDDYYKAHDEMTYEERTHLNYDHPNAFDTELMLQHLRQLKEGEPINCPIYDYTVHNRSRNFQVIYPTNVIVVEGILIFENKELCKEMGVDIDVHKRVCDLGIAYQQIVEILKAVSKKSEFIIMDEPTAPLTVKETAVFFKIIQKLKQDHVTIIFISHRLEEVFEICDRVSVFCDGKYIVSKDVQDITKKQLITYMVGRELSDDYPEPKRKIGETLLKVEHLKNKRVHDVSFELKKGEILGFGGLVGAGRTELVRAIYGADPIESGTITFNGKKYSPKSPADGLEAGIGLIPEDRKAQGCVLSLTIRENIVYSILKKISKVSVVQKKQEKEIVDQYIKELNVKTPSPEQLVKNLSGGNQQKVVLAKALATNCEILIFDEPTRGIDVGAKQEIYNLMCKLVEAGKSIIMISSEMPELIGMSDRIVVMSNGENAGELSKGEYDQTHLLEMASSKL